MYAPRRLTGADGSRPQLSRPLQWRIIDGAATDVPAPTPPRSSPTQIRYAADRAAALPYLRAAIAAGQIGKPHLVHGQYLQDWLLHDSDWSWRLEPD
ncbi:hypothetical protein AB4084_35485, partial [Lysobacter sp. 2RAB21]